MHPFKSTLLILCLILSNYYSHVSCHARKLGMINHPKERKTLSSYESLLLPGLPKGTNTPPSSPSKSHSSTTTTTLNNEKLFARHLAAIDRILGSVPSPGVGHWFFSFFIIVTLVSSLAHIIILLFLFLRKKVLFLNFCIDRKLSFTLLNINTNPLLLCSCQFLYYELINHTLKLFQ